MGSLSFEYPLIFIDCEMSGTDPDNHQLLEISAKMCHKSYPYDLSGSFHSYVGAPDGVRIEDVLKCGNKVALLKTDMRSKVNILSISPPPNLVIVDFINWLPEKYIFVGYNLHLDYQFLKKAANGVYDSGKTKKKLSWRFIDLMSITEILRATGDNNETILKATSSYSLSGLCSNFGLKTEGSHTASGDSEMCKELFKVYVNMLNST